MSCAHLVRFQAASGFELVGRARAGCVAWADVEHWMWPLFSLRWCGWRQSRLGLPAAPILLLPGGARAR